MTVHNLVPLKIYSPKISFSSAGGILGDPGAVSGAGEKSKRARKKFGLLDFSSPEFFSRPFRLFCGPTNWPWVSEDGREEFQLFHFVFLLLFEGTLSTKQHLGSFSSRCSGFLILQQTCQWSHVEFKSRSETRGPRLRASELSSFAFVIGRTMFFH